MSATKRAASNSFGSSQMVVKRQKSTADINGKAMAVTNGGTGSGALIQAVSSLSNNWYDSRIRAELPCEEGQLIEICAQIPRTSGLQAPIMELTGNTTL